MTWNLTMLFVHLAALAALVMLLRGGPDGAQVLVIYLLILATGPLVYHYFAEAVGLATHWQVKSVAYSLEHIGVLLYVFRLFVNDQERRCLQKPSTQLSSSPR